MIFFWIMTVLFMYILKLTLSLLKKYAYLICDFFWWNYLFKKIYVVVVVWVCGSLPTPGPGDTAAGTWWAHFEPIEQSALACFKTAPSSKLLRR